MARSMTLSFMTLSSLSRRLRVLAATSGLLLVAACTQMPEEGPVVTTQRMDVEQVRGGTVYTPGLPIKDATPREIVLGFLEAMKATPVSATVAAEYLSDNGRSLWRPQESTITYRGLTAPDEATDVSLWASGGQRYDRHGSWVGALGGDESRLIFKMVKERGQWRIDDAPDAFLVPATWFRTNFVRSALHFLEPTGRTLVAEPVHVPSGSQQATHLVRGLLAGPARTVEEALRTAVPDGLTLEVNSVPVDEDGLATIALLGRPDALSEGISPAFAAQLAWTLRQVPRVRSMRVSLNGEDIAFGDGRSEATVDGAGQFAPYGASPERMPFTLVQGSLFRGEPGTLERVEGPFGARSAQLRDVSVSLDGSTAVGVSADGTALVQASLVRTAPGSTGADATGADASGPAPAAVRTLLTGRTDLGEPAHDAAGRVWVLDRTAGRSTLLVITEGKVEEVTSSRRVPDTDFPDLLVSPDGTRVVVSVRRNGRDEVHATRVVLDPSSGRMSTGRSTRLPLSLDAGRRVLDLAWVPGQGVAVLSQVAADLSDVQVLTVEGAPFKMVDSDAFRLRPGAKGMAFSVVPGSPRYVYDGQDVRALDQLATVLDRLPVGTSWFGYPG